MQARVKWVEDTLMVGESGSGHAIVLDGPPEQGGRNLGVRPMELLLIGMGACSELDVLHILKRCLLYTSPSPRDLSTSRMPSSA